MVFWTKRLRQEMSCLCRRGKKGYVVPLVAGRPHMRDLNCAIMNSAFYAGTCVCVPALGFCPVAIGDRGDHRPWLLYDVLL